MNEIPFGVFCADEPEVVMPDENHDYNSEQQIDTNWENTQHGTSTYMKWTDDHDA